MWDDTMFALAIYKVDLCPCWAVGQTADSLKVAASVAEQNQCPLVEVSKCVAAAAAPPPPLFLPVAPRSCEQRLVQHSETG